ncbi:uncharacterized protein si:ch211-243a20.4 [Labeo rohita]|uniref:uncharacterized protein si:ch211-243a20.4 n=1 Tax=Labeo rohita TaxID=84645 RepID=UPI0021E333F2|nr:uncharacterized protein si:ch211-243a20.4 [Labeo rohita]
MYSTKLVLCWIVIFCCWQETQAKLAVSMLNRARVALAGDTLDFNLSVVIPANATTSNIECYHTQPTNKMRVWHKELKSEFSETKKKVAAHIKMSNSSSSGHYYFSYANQEVHWVVHVRDKGYQEPPMELKSAIITMMAFSGILLIFSVAGSLYILKSYKEQASCRDDKNEVAKQRPGESDEVILDEDAASASFYTALQYRSSSIYDTLQLDTMHEENTKKKKSDKKHCKEQEDEVFDSVYENL